MTAPTQPLTPDFLCRIGIALAGSTEEWQAALSKALQVNTRTIQRWHAGQLAMPDSLAEDLVEILGARRYAIGECLRQLIDASQLASVGLVRPDPPVDR